MVFGIELLLSSFFKQHIFLPEIRNLISRIFVTSLFQVLCWLPCKNYWDNKSSVYAKSSEEMGKRPKISLNDTFQGHLAQPYLSVRLRESFHIENSQYIHCSSKHKVNCMYFRNSGQAVTTPCSCCLPFITVCKFMCIHIYSYSL